MLSGVAIFDDFLGDEAARALLDFALANEAGFASSTIVAKGDDEVYSDIRRSLTFRGDWDALRAHFRAAVFARMEEILAATGIANWEPKTTQIDLAAHRDGDFYRTHIDTLIGEAKAQSVRMISSVYYYHRRPKGFSDGELRIRDIMSDEEMLITPKHDRLVVFASMLPHEVLPIRIAGNAFEDARFSVNCWINRERD